MTLHPPGGIIFDKHDKSCRYLTLMTDTGHTQSTGEDIQEPFQAKTDPQMFDVVTYSAQKKKLNEPRFVN